MALFGHYTKYNSRKKIKRISLLFIFWFIETTSSDFSNPKYSSHQILLIRFNFFLAKKSISWQGSSESDKRIDVWRRTRRRWRRIRTGRTQIRRLSTSMKAQLINKKLIAHWIKYSAEESSFVQKTQVSTDQLGIDESSMDTGFSLLWDMKQTSGEGGRSTGHRGEMGWNPGILRILPLTVWLAF